MLASNPDDMSSSSSPDVTIATKPPQQTNQFKVSRPFGKVAFLGILTFFFLFFFVWTLWPSKHDDARPASAQFALDPANPTVALTGGHFTNQPLTAAKPLAETVLTPDEPTPEPDVSVLETPPAPAVALQNRGNPYLQDYLNLQVMAHRASAAVSGWGSTTRQKDIDTPAATPASDRDMLSQYAALATLAEERQPDQKNSADQFFETGGGKDKGYLNKTRNPLNVPYVLPAGTMIPCALISGINTDIPGAISAQVTSNVYDWVRHKIVLIPQGSRLFGRYNNHVEQGQHRAQIAWQRLIYPDGSTVSLDGMPGTDRRGYAGLTGKYYPHYGRMFLAALLTGGLAALDEAFSNNKSSTTVTNNGPGTVVVPNNNDSSAGTEFRKAASEAVSGAFADKLHRTLSTPPTIVVKPGTRFYVQLNADIPFLAAWRWK